MLSIFLNCPEYPLEWANLDRLAHVPECQLWGDKPFVLISMACFSRNTQPNLVSIILVLLLTPVSTGLAANKSNACVDIDGAPLWSQAKDVEMSLMLIFSLPPQYFLQ